MTRMAKVLCAAVATVLAASAVVSATAGAASFTAAEYPVTLEASQTESGEKFTVGGSTLTCTTASYSGSMSAASETLAMVPTYSGCTAFGFINATVTGFSSTGCAWHYGANGTASLACKSGDVKIDAGPCSVTMESAKNQNLTSVTYTNNTPVIKHLTKHKGTSNLHAVVTSGFGCPIVGGTYTNATWFGSTVTIAKKGGVTVNIEVT